MKLFARLLFFIGIAMPVIATVPSSTTWVQYTLTTNPQTLTVPFVFQSASDLLVLDSKASPPVPLTLNSDYSVTGGSGSTGTISTIVGGGNAVAVGDVITIYRKVPLTQTTSFVTGGPLTPAIIGQAVDKLTMISQQLNLVGANSLQFQGDERLSGVLPLAARKNAFLAFDANGVPWFPTTASIVGSVTNPIVASTVAAAKIIPLASLVNGATVEIAGYYSPNDGGGGTYIWNAASTTPDDGGTSIQLSGVVTGRLLLRINGPISLKQFGAWGDGSHDDTAAIQNALTYGGDIFVPAGTYLVSPQSNPALVGTFGANSVCLNPGSNLWLHGPGTIRLKSGATGTSGALIGNWTGASVSNIRIETNFDGNASGTTGTVSGVVLVNASGCRIRSTVINTTYVGIQYAVTSTRCSVIDSEVDGCANIGIQAQNPVQITVADCRVYSCGDNGVDVSGNNPSGPSYGEANIINGCQIKACLNGIFLESVAETIVESCWVYNPTNDCLIMNQINSPAWKATIAHNRFFRDVSGGYGVRIINNSGGYTTIEGNDFNGFRSSIRCTIASNVYVGVNTHSSIQKYLCEIDQVSPAGVIDFLMAQQVIYGALTAFTYPFTSPPLDNADNYSPWGIRYNIASAFSVYKAAAIASTVDGEYLRRTVTTQSNPGWGGAYSVFVGGDTIVLIADSTGASAGDYVKLNGTLFLVYAISGGGEWTLRSKTGVAGDYTATTNGAYTGNDYCAAWQANPNL